MKILISPVSIEEARAVCAGGADILDVKNTKEGSLGASFPWIISAVAREAKDRGLLVSATLGDLSYKPGTASLAALGAAAAGARYVKAGLKDMSDEREGLEVMCAVARSCRDFDPDIEVVAAGYADYRRFGGLDPLSIVRIAADSGSHVVMLDTLAKDGSTLFDALSLDELAAFAAAALARGLRVALAGSIRAEHAPRLRALAPDIIGVRGAVCQGLDRSGPIDAELVKAFVSSIRLGR